MREVPQESLGFSPFELLYGKNVRFPKAILRKLWTDKVEDEEVRSTYDYVIILRKRFEHTCEFARKICRRRKGSKRCTMTGEQNPVYSMRETKFYYCSKLIVINYCYNDEGCLKKWNMFLKSLKPC